MVSRCCYCRKYQLLLSSVMDYKLCADANTANCFGNGCGYHQDREFTNNDVVALMEDAYRRANK